MFKKLLSKAGKAVKTTSVAFMHGYNSVNEQEVVNAITAVKVKTEEVNIKHAGFKVS